MTEITEGEIDEAVREYVGQHPDLTMVGERVFAMGFHNDERTISEIDVINCPLCGDLARYEKGRTECCGTINEGTDD